MCEYLMCKHVEKESFHSSTTYQHKFINARPQLNDLLMVQNQVLELLLIYFIIRNECVRNWKALVFAPLVLLFLMAMVFMLSSSSEEQ